MTFWELARTAALWLLVFTTAGWLVSLAVKKASIVDSLWSLCFLVVALVGYLDGNAAALERRTLLLALVAVWAIRLSLHITVRNWGEPEDYRYQEFRRKYGPERYWWFSLFQVFWLQGLLALLVSAPLLVGAAAPAALRALFQEALDRVCFALAEKIVGDGEKITKPTKTRPNQSSQFEVHIDASSRNTM